MKISELDILLAIIPLGIRDLKICADVLEESSCSLDEFYDIIDEYKEMGIDLDKFDVVAIAYEAILQYTRRKIENVTQIDILNDLDGEIYVARNYSATSYDWDSNWIDDFKDKVFDKEEFRTSDLTLEWFLEAIGI